MSEESLQRFGGDWTERKLAALREYLVSWLHVMENQSFNTVYIDAFAGTGYRDSKIGMVEGEFLFADLAEEEPQGFLDGSARIALGVKTPFDRYVFVEKDKARVAALDELRPDFPSLASRIVIKQGEANELIQRWMASVDWRKWRAVLFLDPFGMQVQWETIESVAASGAIDMFLLFPHAVGVNRMLMKDPSKMPTSWKERLSCVFGCDDWFEAFYKVETSDSLFGHDDEMKKIATVEAIGAYFKSRLKGIFPKVAENPLLLKDSKGRPLFQLCFAASNPGRGGDIAINIAEHILGRT